MSIHEFKHHHDAEVAEQLKAHHALMISDLERLSGQVADSGRSDGDFAASKQQLEGWISDVLVPHAEEEEATTYRAAEQLSEGALLIKSMLAEHVLIRHVAKRFAAADNPSAAGAYARVLFDIFDSHQRKENDIVLPLLVESHAVSLAEVMEGSHAHGHDDHGHGDHGHGDQGHEGHDH